MLSLKAEMIPRHAILSRFSSTLFSLPFRWGTQPPALLTMSQWWPWSVLRKRVTNWENFTTTNTWTQKENGRQILITRPLADRTKWRSLNTAKRSVVFSVSWSHFCTMANLDLEWIHLLMENFNFWNVQNIGNVHNFWEMYILFGNVHNFLKCTQFLAQCASIKQEM